MFPFFLALYNHSQVSIVALWATCYYKYWPCDMNQYARFDEFPSMTLKDIKNKQTCKRTNGRTDGRTDNVKTVYPPTNTVCGGYNYTLTDMYKLSSFPPHEKTCFLHICESKGTYHLYGTCVADQRLCFCYIDNKISLLPKSEISSLYPSSIACWTWSETLKSSFSLCGSNVYLGTLTWLMSGLTG